MDPFQQRHGPCERHWYFPEPARKTWGVTLRLVGFAALAFATTLLPILVSTSSQAAPVRWAAAIHLAVAPHAETPLAIQVQPKATCTLPEGNPVQKIFANDEGVVRMNVRPTREATGTFRLECRGEDGALVAFPVELAVTSDPGALAATKAQIKPFLESKPGTLRRALVGDPMAYSQEELLAGGYGQRPDPMKEPNRYAHWLRAVTEPSTVVSSRQVAGSERNGPNENLLWASNWSGGLAGNPSGAWPESSFSYFWYASAEWNVPQVFAESNFANQSNAGTWAGFGGTNGDYLWQAGTGEWTQSIFWFQISGYNAWTQVPPSQSQQQNISNFNVNNGDDVYAEVFICNPTNGAENPTFESYVGLCAHVHNYTQNEDSFISMWFSEFAFLQNAEVIQERPVNGSGGQIDYAQFNPFNFISTDVCATDGHNFVGGCNPISPHAGGIIPGPSPFSITMVQIGSPSHIIGQSCIANYSGACDDNGYFVRVWWDAHN
jgi:hypothetical protein